MDMGVIAQDSVPGMKHTDHADVAAYKPGVEGKFLEGGGRGLKKDVVEGLLIGTDNRPQFLLC